MKPFIFTATAERLTDDHRVDIGRLTLLLEEHGFRVLEVGATDAVLVPKIWHAAHSQAAELCDGMGI